MAFLFFLWMKVSDERSLHRKEIFPCTTFLFSARNIGKIPPTALGEKKSIYFFITEDSGGETECLKHEV